jgi:hypothetical protein
MNEWWSSQPNQRLWVEITDRADLGKNIIAPQRAQAGKNTPGYELLNYVHEGDLVFHWWRKPSDPELRGFYGYSEVVGKMQEGIIPWKSRGRYAENEVAGPKPAKYWNLANFTGLQKPFLVSDLNEKKNEVFDLILNLEKKYGKPIYFPFCKREGKVAANQTYFAKLPVELLEILELNDFIAEMATPSTDSSSKTRVKPNLEATAGVARQMDPEKRSTVEKYAESEVKKYLVSLGYMVQKFGKPFDFLATKDDVKVKVEVKGKQEFAVNVEVTINEVEVARNLEGTHRTLLAVVDGIELNQIEGVWNGSGGRLRTWWDMPFDESSLFPIRFQFTLPVD